MCWDSTSAPAACSPAPRRRPGSTALLEEMRDFLAGFFGVIHRYFAGFFQALAAFTRGTIRHTIRFLAALSRLHRDGFRGVVDALDHHHAGFQAVSADVIDFFRGLFGALHRIMHHDVVAFL